MTTTLTPGEDRRGLTLAGAGVQVRADGDGPPRFAGHAAVFDSRTAIGNPLTWGFYEEIAPGAFTNTLSEGDARMLIDHDSYYVVSRVSAGSLALAQDRAGLAVDSALDPELSYVADLTANLRNGNITGMSFGFFVVKDEWDVETVETSDGQTAEVEVRRLLELRLVEVSAVTFPAYEETDAGVRARMRAEDEVRAVGLALGRRDHADQLLEARSRHCPGLADYRIREAVTVTARASEPGETTRQPSVVEAPADDDQPLEDALSTEQPDQHARDDEPAETTRPTLRELMARRPAPRRASA